MLVVNGLGLFNAQACVPSHLPVQVHSAKRSSGALAHRAGSSCGPTPPRQQAARDAPGGVPPLPLASLSRAGSSASSRPSSGRHSSRENEQQATAAHKQQQKQSWQVPRSSPFDAPAATLQRAISTSLAGGLFAVGPGLNGLPSTRDEPGWSPDCPPKAGLAAPADRPPPRKESRFSLPQLLSTTPIGGGAAPQRPSAPVPPSVTSNRRSLDARHSSFSVLDIAGAAAAASSAGAANGAYSDAAKPVAAAATGGRATPVRKACFFGTGACLLPGEAAASPLASTGQEPLAADATPAAGGVRKEKQCRFYVGSMYLHPVHSLLEVAFRMMHRSCASACLQPGA